MTLFEMKSTINKILRLIKRNKESGYTITELTQISGIARSTVRDCLSFLLGQDKIEYRKVGMAKIYRIKMEDTTK